MARATAGVCAEPEKKSRGCAGCQLLGSPGDGGGSPVGSAAPERRRQVAEPGPVLQQGARRVRGSRPELRARVGSFGHLPAAGRILLISIPFSEKRVGLFGDLPAGGNTGSARESPAGEQSSGSACSSRSERRLLLPAGRRAEDALPRGGRAGGRPPKGPARFRLPLGIRLLRSRPPGLGGRRTAAPDSGGSQLLANADKPDGSQLRGGGETPARRRHGARGRRTGKGSLPSRSDGKVRAGGGRVQPDWPCVEPARENGARDGYRSGRMPAGEPCSGTRVAAPGRGVGLRLPWFPRLGRASHRGSLSADQKCICAG